MVLIPVKLARMVRSKGQEFIDGKMALPTRAITSKVRGTVMASFSGLTGKATKGNITMMNALDLGNISGQTARDIPVNF